MKPLFWSVALIGLLSGSAEAFDYVDSHGFRHWNHYGDRQASTRKEIVQNRNKPKVEIIEDTVKFRPVDEPPTEEK
jgi:hypothetical protein